MIEKLIKTKCQKKFEKDMKELKQKNLEFIKKKEEIEKKKDECDNKKNIKKNRLYNFLLFITDKCLFINSGFLIPLIICYVIPKSIVGFFDLKEMIKKIKSIQYIKNNFKNKKLKKQIIYYYNTYVKFILNIVLQIIEIIGCLTSILCIYKMTTYNIPLCIFLGLYTIYNILLISVGSYLLDYWKKLSNDMI